MLDIWKRWSGHDVQEMENESARGDDGYLACKHANGSLQESRGVSISGQMRRTTNETHQLLDGALDNRSFVLVTPTPFVSIAINALEILAARRIIEDNWRSQELLFLVF